MARYLVTLKYNGKEYAVTTTACDENNAIEFSIDDCVRVAAKATGKDSLEIYDDIERENFTAIQI